MKFNQLPSNIKYKLVCSFINRLVASTIFPFIIVIINRMFDEQIASKIIIIGVIFQITSTIIGGMLSDSLGRKKILLLGQLCHLTCACFISVVLIFNLDKNLFLILYLLNSLFGNIHSATKDALILDGINKKEKHKVCSLDYWITNLTTAIGLILGSLFVLDYLPVLYVLLSLATAYTIYVYQIKICYNNQVNNKAKKAVTISDIKLILKDKQYLLLLVGTVLIFSVELGFSTVMSLHMYKTFSTINLFGFMLNGINQFAMFQIINMAMIVFFSNIIIDKVMKINKNKSIFIISVNVNIVGYFIVMTSNALPLMIIALLIVAVAEMVYAPIRQVAQINLIPANNRAMYFGISSTFLQVTNLITAFYLFSYDFFNINLIAIFMGLFGLIGVKIIAKYID